MRNLLVTVVISALVAACGSDDDDTTTTPMPTTPAPSPTTPAPTFTQVYATLGARCGSCHATPDGLGVTQGRLDISTPALAYANLVGAQAKGAACAGQAPLVVAGRSHDSLLYLKVSLDDPTPCGSKMPPIGPMLSQSEVDLVAGWIDAGARND